MHNERPKRRGMILAISLAMLAAALGLYALYQYEFGRPHFDFAGTSDAPYPDQDRALEQWPWGDAQIPPRRAPELVLRPLPHGPDSHRVVLLGVDGADWRLLEPMIDAGLLPNLEALLAGGAAGVLQTDFAVSPTSWTTIATGKIASHHGLTPDLDLAWGAQRLEPRNIRVRRVWEIAVDMGRTIAVYNFFFARVRPPGDWGWIAKALPSVEELPAGLTVEGCPAPAGLSTDLNYLYQQACLTRRRPTDLIVILAPETDEASHNGLLVWYRKWHPEMFDRDDRVPGLSGVDELTGTWIEVDGALGRLWADRPEGCHFVICSDHGFGLPIARKITAELGPMTLGVLGQSRESIKGTVPIRVETSIGVLHLASRWKIEPMFTAHLRGRSEPEKTWISREILFIGRVGPPSSDWADRLQALMRRELGPLMNLLEIEQIDDRTLTIAPTMETVRRFVLHKTTTEEKSAVRMDMLTGSHRTGDDGVVLIVGPKVRPGARILDAELADIAPTILYIMGLPVARDMDGRVLEEAFRPEALTAEPVTYVDTYETSPVERDPIDLGTDPLSESDLDPEMLQRLRSLGYIQ